MKLAFSAIVPASFDLRDIVTLGFGRSPVGPWLALYPPLYTGWFGKEQIALWLQSSPASMGLDLRFLSLIFRLPVFLFDLATMSAIYYVGTKLSSPDKGRLASLIWYLNPYAFFSIELTGVPDVVATFLIVLSFNLVFSRRALLAALVLGIGIWVKLFPLFLLPPILLYFCSQGIPRKHVWAALVLCLSGFVGYLSWILPFGSMYSTAYTPVTQIVPFIAGTPYSVNGSAFAIISFYCLLILFAKKGAIIAASVSTFMAYYLVSNPSPQYLMWVLPLIALDVVLGNGSRTIFAVTFYALAFGQWFLTSSAFLTPSGYSLLMMPLAGNNLPSYAVAIGRFLDSRMLGIILPLVSSSLYASVLVYGIDAARSWFLFPFQKHE
jgi:uncharacterized membrane protein